MRLGCVLKPWHNVCVSTTFLAFHIVSANQITEQSVSLKRLICICALKRYKRFLETLFTVSANQLALSKRCFPFRPIIRPFRTVCMLDQSNHKYLLDGTKPCFFTTKVICIYVLKLYLYLFYFILFYLFIFSL